MTWNTDGGRRGIPPTGEHLEKVACCVLRGRRGHFLDDGSQDQVVAVLDYPLVRDMKPGMVLILAKVNCEPIDECLIARRVTRLDAKYGVETEPYGGAEGLLVTQINATLLGSVAYTVNLGTGAIRDMRADAQHGQGEPATISLNEATAREYARTRATPAADPHGI